MSHTLEQQLEYAIQSPIFSKGPVTYLEEDELMRRLKPILKERIAKTKYNRVTIAEQFLDHYLTHPGNSVLEALATFHLDSGSTSLGLVLDLIDHLPDEICAYPVAAILPKEHHYGHIAALIAFQNPEDESDHGMILLDPGRHISEPILLRRTGYYCTYEHGKKKPISNFHLLEDHIVCQQDAYPSEEPWPEDKVQETTMVYRIDQIENPEESILLPHFATDRIFPIISRHKDGSERAHIDIDFNKREIRARIEDESQVIYSFDQLPKEPFGYDMADALVYERDTLNHIIHKIVSHAELFDRLYFDYLNRLKQVKN